jgi:hypothetical protein
MIGNRQGFIKSSPPEQYVGESAESVGVIWRALEYAPILDIPKNKAQLFGRPLANRGEQV